MLHNYPPDTTDTTRFVKHTLTQRHLTYKQFSPWMFHHDTMAHNIFFFKVISLLQNIAYSLYIALMYRILQTSRSILDFVLSPEFLVHMWPATTKPGGCRRS